MLAPKYAFTLSPSVRFPVIVPPARASRLCAVILASARVSVKYLLLVCSVISPVSSVILPPSCALSLFTLNVEFASFDNEIVGNFPAGIVGKLAASNIPFVGATNSANFLPLDLAIYLLLYVDQPSIVRKQAMPVPAVFTTVTPYCCAAGTYTQTLPLAIYPPKFTAG